MQSRYEGLDSLRGVAAVAVVVYHLAQTRLFPSLLPHGYLAVDFFFMLSGVVIAHAYEAKLGRGLTWRGFAARRVIRLYPLAIVGAAMGLLVLLGKYVKTPDKVDALWQILVSGGFNVALLPTFFGGERSLLMLFPGNGPLWSLFYEVVINLVWAAVMIGRSTAWLLAVIGASAALLFAAILANGGANIGWDQTTFWAGFARVSFGFTVGLVLYRLRGVVAGLGSRWLLPVVAVILVLVLAGPKSAWWDIVAVAVVLPGLVLVSIAQGANRFGVALGELSYPLYILHFPVLLFASGVRQFVLPGTSPVWIGVAALLSSVGIAWLALRCFDEPVRRHLSSRFVARGDAPSAPPNVRGPVPGNV